jgi:hypothetical protein
MVNFKYYKQFEWLKINTLEYIFHISCHDYMILVKILDIQFVL